MKRTFVGVSLLAATLALTGCRTMLQDRLYPSADCNERVPVPDVAKAKGWQRDWVLLNDRLDRMRLELWWTRSTKRDSKVTVIFFHGNNQNLGTLAQAEKGKISVLDGFRARLAPYANIIAYDYPSYGNSTGNQDHIDQTRMLKSGEEVIEWALDHFGEDQKIVLMGHSLGGTVATHLAASSDIDGLISSSTFSSMADLEADKAGWAIYVYDWGDEVRLWKKDNKYDTAEAASELECHVLLIHSVADEAIPFEQGEKIFKAAQKRAASVKGIQLEDLLHKEVMSSEYVLSEIADFLRKLGRKKEALE